MPPDPKEPTPPEKLRSGLKHLADALRATRNARLGRAARRIESWSRKRPFRALAFLVAFLVAIKPIYTAISDTTTFVGEKIFGVGLCYERDGRTPEFDKTKFKRTCLPDEVTLLTWREGAAAKCPDCDNRALQLTAVRADGHHTWTEYYLDEKSSPESRRWLPAHNWETVAARSNRGNDSNDEGMVLRRIDDGTPVCSHSGMPLALEFFVSSEAGLGCPSSSWGASAPFAWFREAREHLNGYRCDGPKNRLYVRWTLARPKDVHAACVDDQADQFRRRAEPPSPVTWDQGGARITVLRRD